MEPLGRKISIGKGGTVGDPLQGNTVNEAKIIAYQHANYLGGSFF